MKSRIVLSFFFVAVVSGCTESRCARSSTQAVGVASCYALDNKIPLDSMRIDSVTRMSNGETSVIESYRKDEFASNFRGKLIGKEYDEVCMMPKTNVLGGGVCFYIEVNSGQLLIIYRGV
jgi:hypothetical protein